MLETFKVGMLTSIAISAVIIALAICDIVVLLRQHLESGVTL